MKGEGEIKIDAVRVPVGESGRLFAHVTPPHFLYLVDSAGTLVLGALPCRETDNLPRIGICEGENVANLKT